MPQNDNGVVNVGGYSFNPADFSGVSAGGALKLTAATILSQTIPIIGGILGGILTALGIRGSTVHLPPNKASEMANLFKDKVMADLESNGFPFEAQVDELYPHQMLAKFGINWLQNPTTALPPLSLGRAEFAVEMQSVGDPNSGNRKASFAGALWSISNMIFRNGDAETVESESGNQLQYVMSNALAPMWVAIRANRVPTDYAGIAKQWVKPLLLVVAGVALIFFVLPKIWKGASK